MTPRYVNIPGVRTFTNDDGYQLTERMSSAFDRLEPGTDSNTGDHTRPHAQSFIKSGGATSLNGISLLTVTNPGSKDRWNLYNGCGISNFINSPGMSYSQVAYNQAVGKIASAIRGDVDLSVDLLDARKGIDMVKKMWHTVKSARNLFARLEGTRNPREAGSLWLEWQYGWKPTAYSIYGCLENLLTPGAQWVRVQAKGYETREVSGTENFPGYPGIVRKVMMNTSDRVYFDLVFGPETSTLQALGRYTSLNPISIAYERLPLSYVLDWVCDIGGYLRQVETALVYGSRFHSGFCTRTQMSTLTESVNGISRVNSNTTYQMNCAGEQWRKMKQRDVVTTYPMPYPPKIDPQFGTSRLISAASLLSQQVKSWENVRPRVR